MTQDEINKIIVAVGEIIVHNNKYEGYGRLFKALGFINYLSLLSPRDYKMLEFRYGFDSGVVHSLEDTGQEYGVTRERIRQIEARSLETIKNHISQ